MPLGIGCDLVRKGLSIEELGDLLQRPFNATLATYRRDGSVLLSPVWHEWREGGFSIISSPDDVKVRHIERQGRAAAVVADNDFPFRGIEVSGVPTIVRDAAFGRETLSRIAPRYLGEEGARVYMSHSSDEGTVVIRLVPGTLRTWDFADDAETFGATR
jgi:PPOX class probable F420-dependent enzyme